MNVIQMPIRRTEDKRTEALKAARMEWMDCAEHATVMIALANAACLATDEAKARFYDLRKGILKGEKS